MTITNLTCKQCNEVFTHAHVTNIPTYCKACVKQRLKESQRRYARRRHARERTEFMARVVPHPDFTKLGYWLDPLDDKIYRRDRPRKFVKIGQKGVLDVRKKRTTY